MLGGHTRRPALKLVILHTTALPESQNDLKVLFGAALAPTSTITNSCVHGSRIRASGGLEKQTKTISQPCMCRANSQAMRREDIPHSFFYWKFLPPVRPPELLRPTRTHSQVFGSQDLCRCTRFRTHPDHENMNLKSRSEDGKTLN